MKRILPIVFIAAALLSACSAHQTAQTQDIVQGASACEKPAQFESEGAFVNAIKNGGESNGWDISSITHYYRPKNVPDKAILQYVQVRDTYVMFVYTLDSDKQSKDMTQIMKVGWFREFGGYEDNFITDDIERGWNEQQLEGAAKGTTYVAEKSFNESKALKDDTINVAWGVSWVQDGECFGGSVPYTIPEEDIAKYLEMEKVVIE